MRFTGVYLVGLLAACLWVICASATDGNKPEGDSWLQVSRQKQGTITCLWYPIEPFIYRNANGELCGLEYDLMEGLKIYVRDSLGIQLQVRWVNAGRFERIYPAVKNAVQPGLFGLSYYSITPERRREVAFSPPYMPDLNVLCTHPALPNYSSVQEFSRSLPGLKAYTMKHTTMEEDVLKLKQILHLDFEVSNEMDDYDILRAISNRPNSFGYVPLSIYVVALQRGIKIKRQVAMGTSREGLAAIFPAKSDWKPVIDAYFLRPATKAFITDLTAKYLGSEISEIVLQASLADSLRTEATDMELLIKEREMVTSRLVETALEVARRKQQNKLNWIIFGGLFMLLLILYSRFRVKQKLNEKLNTQNLLITNQYKQIAAANIKIELKMLQTRLNPDFLYNSLNAIQYFVVTGNQKATLTYINRFSVFLRLVMGYHNQTAITLIQEAELLERYLWLEKERFSDKIDYKLKYAAQTSEEYPFPPMLSLSIAEQVLYEILQGTKQDVPLQLQVQFVPQAGAVQLRLNDNGAERPDTAILYGSLADRIRLLNAEGIWKIEHTAYRQQQNNVIQFIIKKN